MQKTLDTMTMADLQSLEEDIGRQKKAKRSPKAVSDNIHSRMKIGGGKVVDATRPLEIRITADDVRRGALKNATACAAARALCREGFTEARVHAARTYVRRRNGTWLRYFTGDALRSEVVAFDRGGAFEPGLYRLSPIQPAERIGARAQRQGSTYKKSAERRRAAPKRKNHVTTGVRSRFLPD